MYGIILFIHYKNYFLSKQFGKYKKVKKPENLYTVYNLASERYRINYECCVSVNDYFSPTPFQKA